jgi:ABC-type branched-subunit amino acid transport system substrate-binding protein
MHLGLRTAAAAALALGLGVAPFTGARAADPLEVNALLPMTGQTAFYGQAIAKSLTVEESAINAAGGINGRDIHFNFLDDQANPQIAIQLTAGLLSKGVPAIIDGGPAATCKATATTAKSAAVVFCLSGAYQPDAYSFTTPMSFEDALAAQIRFFRTRGLKRIGFLVGTDATGQAADVAITNVLAYPENRGVTAAAREHFGNQDISVAAQVTNIRNAGAQAVFASASGTPLATILREMRDTAMTIPIATTASNQSVPQLVSYGGIVPADLEMVAARWAAYDAMGNGPVKDKVAVFRTAMARGGLDADGPASIAWDFGQFIAAGYRKFGGAMTPANLRDYVAGMRNVPGICGFYDFVTTPGRGLTSKDTVVLRWNGTRKTFDPISSPGGASALH